MKSSQTINGNEKAPIFQVEYDANARTNYPNTQGVSLMTNSNGELVWTDKNDHAVTIVSPLAGDSTVNLPSNATMTLVDTNTSQSMSNKTMNVADGNIIEVGKLMGANIDTAAPTYTTYGALRYELATNKWKYITSITGSTPLSLDYGTNVMSVAVGGGANTVCAGDDPRFVYQNVINVKKNPSISGGEFGTISDAIDEVLARGDATEDNRYIISIDGGEFIEPLLNLPDHVTLRGVAIYQTIITNDDGSHDTVVCNYDNELRELLVRGATGVGCANVRYTGLDRSGGAHDDSYCQLTKVEIDEGETCIIFDSQGYGELYMEYCEMYGPYKYAVVQQGYHFDDPPTNLIPTVCYVDMGNTYIFASDNNTRLADVYVGGAGSLCRCIACGVNGIQRLDTTDVPCFKTVDHARAQIQTMFIVNASMNSTTKGGRGIVMESGSQMTATGLLTYNLNYALQILNVGDAEFFDGDILTVSAGIECVRVDHPNATGNIRGNMVNSKLFISASNNYVAINMYDNSTAQPTLTAGSLLVGSATQQKFDIVQYAITQDVGLVSGGIISISDTMKVANTSGTGYLSYNSFIRYVTFTAQEVTFVSIYKLCFQQ